MADLLRVSSGSPARQPLAQRRPRQRLHITPCPAAGDGSWSWRVAAGQNAAYDQFSNQIQLYYYGKGKDTLWYDPVFQVHPHPQGPPAQRL